MRPLPLREARASKVRRAHRAGAAVAGLELDAAGALGLPPSRLVVHEGVTAGLSADQAEQAHLLQRSHGAIGVTCAALILVRDA